MYLHTCILRYLWNAIGPSLYAQPILSSIDQIWLVSSWYSEVFQNATNLGQEQQQWQKICTSTSSRLNLHISKVLESSVPFRNNLCCGFFVFITRLGIKVPGVINPIICTDRWHCVLDPQVNSFTYVHLWLWCGVGSLHGLKCFLLPKCAKIKGY